MENIFSKDVLPSAAASLWQLPKVRHVDQGAGEREAWAGGQQGLGIEPMIPAVEVQSLNHATRPLGKSYNNILKITLF